MHISDTSPSRDRVSARALLLAVAMTLISVQLLTAVPATAVPGPIAQRTAASVTADALPTSQINGVVWSQAVAGNTVFAGGEFTSVRPAGAAPGTSESPRHNLMSYDIRTGVHTAFAPVFDGPIQQLTLSADGQTLFVGGQFTKVNNANRYRLAAFSVSTGALTSLAPRVNSSVYAIASIGNTVYIGGSFNAIGSVPRTRLAALDASTGAVTGWAPTTDGSVQALVPTPDKTGVVVGGNFAKLNSTAAVGMGALNASTGAVRPWKANTIIKNSGPSASIIALNADNDTVYATGYVYGPGGNFEGMAAADPTTGNVKWIQDCRGDTYDVAPIGGVVYTASHSHNCPNIGGFPETPTRSYHRALAVTKAATGTVAPASASFGGQPAPSLYNWFPDLNFGTYTTLNQGPWSVRGNSSYVSLAGEFTRVNGTAQQGLVRMAVPSLAPNKQGPRVSGEAILPTVTPQAGYVKLAWPSNWDRDDKVLSYEVRRNNVVIKTIKATSYFWRLPTLTFNDYSGKPGSSYQYKIRIFDPNGNSVTSPIADQPSVTVTYPADTSYAQRVKADRAAHQWRLGSAAGKASDPDTVAGLAMTVGSGVTFGAAGALPRDVDTAVTMSGSASTAATTSAAGATSIEAWFKTSSGAGGALVGFGSPERSGPSVSGDRAVYLTSSGQVAFAEHPGGRAAVVATTSPKSYADGAWHQLVAVNTGAGQQLYVDGTRVAASTTTAAVPSAAGRWYLGGGTASDLPGRSTATFSGTLDEVAVFSSALTGPQVRDHYLLAQPGYTLVNGQPGPR